MVDSGGQYLDGTTDVTRTFHYGTPTEEMVDRYTDVLQVNYFLVTISFLPDHVKPLQLQGAIELARVKAPDGTLDSSVDLATRYSTTTFTFLLSLMSRLYSEIGTLAARQFLFQQGLDYRHGTGHGVGAYLEVPGHVDKDTYMQP